MIKTVKVRVAVAVGEFGEWQAIGWSIDMEGKNASETDAMNSACEDIGPMWAGYWLEAELPVPESVTVRADVVNVDKEIMGGKPVLRTTRFPIANVFAELSDNKTIQDIAEDFGLEKDDLVVLMRNMARQADVVEADK